METDLISRKATVETVKKLLCETALNSCGRHQDDEIYADIAENRIGIWIGLVPSVPAVPIGQLCMWLQKTKKTPACAECRAAGIQCGEYGLCGSKEHWQALFPKILEEFHEHR